MADVFHNHPTTNGILKVHLEKESFLSVSIAIKLIIGKKNVCTKINLSFTVTFAINLVTVKKYCNLKKKNNLNNSPYDMKD